jgi:hypothetical protein
MLLINGVSLSNELGVSVIRVPYECLVCRVRHIRHYLCNYPTHLFSFLQHSMVPGSIRSSDVLIDLILSAAIWLWGPTQFSNRYEYEESSWW